MLHIIILAAGKGSRMRSSLPKVLHPLAGKPLLQHVIDTARTLKPGRITVVIGFGGDAVRQAVSGDDIHWAFQPSQDGSGDAVRVAFAAAAACGHQTPSEEVTLVLYGDVPLLSHHTLLALLNAKANASLSLLTAVTETPEGYGRIVRNPVGNILAIVEEKDADSTARRIKEINTGVMAADSLALQTWVARLKNHNAQGEFYLTDVVAFAAEKGQVAICQASSLEETQGVNSRAQLATLERYWQGREAEALMAAGVSLADPARLDIRGQLHCAADVFIDVGCVFEGTVSIATGCRIGPYSYLRNTTLAAGAEVLPFCHLDGVTVGEEAAVGPYSRLRPGTVLAPRSHVGNFVEFKNVTFGEGSKAGHLSYLGDTEVGAKVNIGAGVITCNYDGAHKHRTVIEEGAFIGSDCQLVAPVVVGANATLGAGTTLTRNAPADSLTVSRSPQKTIPGWLRPRKEKP